LLGTLKKARRRRNVFFSLFCSILLQIDIACFLSLKE